MVVKRYILHFPKEIVDKPVVYKLAKDFDLIFSIFRGRITPNEEGHLAIEVDGDKKQIEKGIKYIKSLNIKVEPFSNIIKMLDDKCTQCSLCVAHCPTKALHIPDKKTMKVELDSSKCIVCEKCIKVCPYNAIKVEF